MHFWWLDFRDFDGWNLVDSTWGVVGTSSNPWTPQRCPPPPTSASAQVFSSSIPPFTFVAFHSFGIVTPWNKTKGDKKDAPIRSPQTF